MFLRISIVLTILAVFGASISGVLHQKARQEKIQEALSQLSTQDPDMRIHAVNTLIKLKAKEAISKLTTLLQDNNEYVRSAARDALKALGVEVPEKKK